METVTKKLNLTKEDREYYGVGKLPEIKYFDETKYIAISGKGDPNMAPFQKAIEKTYALAYRIKFLCKSEDNDFVIPKMECYWFLDGDMENQKNFINTSPSEWLYKIMIRMPDFVSEDHFLKAIFLLKQKNATDYSDLKFHTEPAGACAQILHIGSWSEESESITTIFDFVEKSGYNLAGYHREIYLSDPKRVEEAKLKTILRYAVTK